jgi:hypothetical protein
LERAQNPSQDTSTEEKSRNSNFRSGSEDFTTLRVGVVSFMATDSSSGWHIAFVRVSCCAAIYDGALINIAILSSSGEGDYEDETEKPREPHDDGGVNFVGNVLSRVAFKCRKVFVVCLACRDTLFGMRRGDVSGG